MQYVSVGRRFGALLIDVLVSLLWSIPLSESTRIETVSGGSFYSFGLRGWHFVAALAIWLVYATVLEAAFGATLGKLAAGIRVVGTDGKRISASQAIIRNLARVIDAFPWFFPYVLGAIFIWNSPTRQRLGDRWANTVVIVRGSNEGTAEGSIPAWSAVSPAAPPPLPPPPRWAQRRADRLPGVRGRPERRTSRAVRAPAVARWASRLLEDVHARVGANLHGSGPFRIRCEDADASESERGFVGARVGAGRVGGRKTCCIGVRERTCRRVNA
jgi:uncharacterized RDD family membrane protein YckC